MRMSADAEDSVIPSRAPILAEAVLNDPGLQNEMSILAGEVASAAPRGGADVHCHTGDLCSSLGPAWIHGGWQG